MLRSIFRPDAYREIRHGKGRPSFAHFKEFILADDRDAERLGFGILAAGVLSGEDVARLFGDGGGGLSPERRSFPSLPLSSWLEACP